ncbi:MltR family transcriptional regulator [Bradyrhizobium sp. CCBAU 53380]|uniref:MltR family transcriptional regulator n=1 Tax=Bradyrhizobium sp. CCBAU 53380 TaxID=1325117 RepID=UPI002303A2E1|nr:MltR family transcriptional regulator [Bradyrhizobium sp. CCBAU 53380]
MSKALKNLSRSLGGTPEEINKLFAYMKKDSARGAVASMSSLIEEALASAIKHRLVPLTEKEESNLFENNGPLSTLSSRINMGYALGIYGAKARRDLNLLREIRNAFVHSIRHIEFDTPEVAQLCRTFYCSEAIEGFKSDAPRDQYFQAATRVTMCVALHEYDEVWKRLLMSYPEYSDDPPQTVRYLQSHPSSSEVDSPTP